MMSAVQSDLALIKPNLNPVDQGSTAARDHLLLVTLTRLVSAVR